MRHPADAPMKGQLTGLSSSCYRCNRHQRGTRWRGIKRLFFAFLRDGMGSCPPHMVPRVSTSYKINPGNRSPALLYDIVFVAPEAIRMRD